MWFPTKNNLSGTEQLKASGTENSPWMNKFDDVAFDEFRITNIGNQSSFMDFNKKYLETNQFE